VRAPERSIGESSLRGYPFACSAQLPAPCGGPSPIEPADGPAKLQASWLVLLDGHSLLVQRLPSRAAKVSCDQRRPHAWCSDRQLWRGGRGAHIRYGGCRRCVGLCLGCARNRACLSGSGWAGLRGRSLRRPARSHAHAQCTRRAHTRLASRRSTHWPPAQPRTTASQAQLAKAHAETAGPCLQARRSGGTTYYSWPAWAA